MQLQYPTSSGFWSSSASAKVLHMLLVLVALNLSINHVSAANRHNNETDQLALLGFKNQIYDPLGVLNSWNHSLHHCQWPGVKCGNRHQRVIALNLTGMSLSGTISPHIGNLSFMKSIHLEENNFHGEIPQEIGHLFRLRFLNLSYNILSGKIPVSLSNCSNILSITLTRNKLEGKVPVELTFLKKLENLYISVNKLTGEIPSSIGNLSSLKILFLAYNNLEGNMPKEIGFLTNLYMLGVGANKLSGMVPASVYNISSLLSISIGDNSFHGNLPTNIGLNLPNLQDLIIGMNEFYGKIPVSITNASRLEVLKLGDNKFQGQVPTNIGDLSNLQILSLSQNRLGSNSTEDLSFISSLTNNSNLRSILLADNNFGGEVPKFMANLSYELTKLSLGENQISGTIPEGLGNFANLIVFDMSRNSISGVIPSDFGKFESLQYLDLQRNRLSGEISSTICNITTLSHLNLADNLFEGSNIFGNILMNCQNLQYLDVSTNNLSGVIPPHFFDTHTSLVYLSLRQNTFIGSLPLEVGKLTHLVNFSLAYNKFSGEIPSSLVDCLSLENLEMRANFFQGTIPSILVSLKAIQQLDLSSNNLTGQIPRDLEKLQYLRYLNLSYNDLYGEIPITGVFGNASQITLIGNKLCGGIPELDFPPCPVIKEKKKQKFNIIILLSTVLPVMVLVVGILLFYTVTHQKMYRRNAGLPMVPTTFCRFNKLLRVSYYELHRATSGFSPENLIGRGSFGAVYKGRLDQHGDRLVAVKVLDLQKNGASKSFKAECRALRNIRHRNLVSILSYCSSLDSMGNEFEALVYTFMENGNLDSWLHPGEATHQAKRLINLNIFQRLNIAIDVASGLHYLHNHTQRTVVHCDIKPSNILLDDDFVAHVGDFGLARLLPKTINTSSEQGTSNTVSIRGSIGYIAPEYGMGLPVWTQGDVYAYGILLLEMFTGRRPTDDMFKDGLDLHNYVKRALLEHVFMIVDPSLLSNGDANGEVTTQVEPYNDERRMQCIASVLKIGIKCSAALPNDRMPMDEIERKLHLIKDRFLGVRMNTKDLDI